MMFASIVTPCPEGMLASRGFIQEAVMPDDKSIIDKAEEKAKEIGKKIEEVLEDMGADEERLKVTYPNADKPSDPVQK